MSREEFLRRLEQLLSDIPEGERNDAVEYYRNYFEDAGPENEKKIIEELGSPEKVAASIKKDLFGEDMDDIDREAARKKEHAMFEKQKKENRNLRIILILVGAVLTFPIWITVLALIFALLVALAACVFALAVALISVEAAFLVSGFVLIGIGIAQMFTGILSIGFLLVSAGMICLALGVVGLLAVVAVIRCIPWMLRTIVSLCKKPFQRRGAAV